MSPAIPLMEFRDWVSLLFIVIPQKIFYFLWHSNTSCLVHQKPRVFESRRTFMFGARNFSFESSENFVFLNLKNLQFLLFKNSVLQTSKILDMHPATSPAKTSSSTGPSSPIMPGFSSSYLLKLNIALVPAIWLATDIPNTSSEYR